MRETRIYDSGDGWLDKVELWHGGSETVEISNTRKEDRFPQILRRWKPYKRPEDIKDSWLPKALERAKNNGDL